MDRSNFVRVAVVQMAYHPAYVSNLHPCLEDPVYQEGLRHSLYPPDVSAKGRTALIALRARVAGVYLEQLVARVTEIIEQCGRWGVRVLVFPEYSIPAEALERVAQAIADGQVVVAGTHHVGMPGVGETVYERLAAPGALVDVRPGQAVCPVFIGKRLAHVQPKIAHAEGEKIESGHRWKSVPLPDLVGAELGVLVCIDFLARASGPVRDVVGAGLEPPLRLLAVPSLTRNRSVADFTAKALEDAKRYKRPVLYSNSATYLFAGELGGGSQIFADGAARAAAFPESLGVLGGGEEGLIVADVDFGLARRGPSTPYSTEPTVRPYALANFVYPQSDVDRSYAHVLGELAAASDLAAALAVLTSHTELLRSIQDPPARRHRLTHLLDGLNQVTSMEDVQLLTREVVFSEVVAPIPRLRAAMAHGVLECARGELWKDDVAALRAIEDRLVPVQSQSDLNTTLEREVAASVRGPRKQSVAFHKLLGVVDKWEEEARAALDADDYEEAHRRYAKLATDVEELLAGTPGEQALLVKHASALFGTGQALLNLQLTDKSADVLSRVSPGHLRPEARSSLAGALALVGRLPQARSVLAAIDANTKGHAEACRLVAMAEGTIPPIETLKTKQELALASQIAAQNRDARLAVSLAVKALAAEQTANPEPVIHAICVFVLVHALQESVLETSAVPLTLAERASTVARIELALAGDWATRVPPALHEQLQRARLTYAQLVEDYETIDSVGSKLQGDDATEQSELEALALGGEWDRLREHLRQDHPWLGSLRFAQARALAAHELALEEAMTLSQQWPERAPIEHLVARLLFDADRALDAHAHALVACEQLPGRGQLLQLARILVALQRFQEALDVVGRLPSTFNSAHVRALRARCSEFAASEHAIARWNEYLQVAPDDAKVRIHVASLQFVRGEHGIAADAAWGAFRDAPVRLGWEELRIVAHLQQGAPEQKERVKEVARVLATRFPGNPQAEQVRLRLLLRIGEPLDVDLALLASAKLVEPIPDEQLLERLREISDARQKRALLAERLYTAGNLSFEALCALSDQFHAAAVEAAFEPGDAFLLSAAIEGADEPVDGADVLTSDLELLLLDRLGYLDTFLAKIRRVVVFDDVFDRIHSQWLQEPIRADSHRDLLDLLKDDERVEIVDAIDGSGHAVLSVLKQSGLVSAAAEERIRASLPSAGPGEDVASPLPLSDALVGALHGEGLLRDVLSAENRVRVPRQCVERIAVLCAAAQRSVKANERAKRLHESIAAAQRAGRLEVVARLPFEGLPPLKEGLGPGAADFLLNPATRALSYRRALEGNRRLWLTVDLFESAPFDDIPVALSFQWAPETWRATSIRLRAVDARRISISQVLRSLQASQRAFEQLALVGVADAMDAPALSKVLRGYATLKSPRVSRLLACLERVATSPSTRAEAHRVRVAVVYANVIVGAFHLKDPLEATDSPTEPDPSGVTHCLLDRAEAIDAHAGTSLLETVLFVAMLVLADRGVSAFARRENADVYDVSPDSRAGRLLAAIRAWVSEGRPRAVVFHRALSEAWVAFDKQVKSEPSNVQSTGLALATDTQRTDGPPPVDLTGCAISSLAILSGNWQDRPLSRFGTTISRNDGASTTHLSYEQMLTAGVDALKRGDRLEARGEELVYPVSVNGDAIRIEVAVPPEALLLRTTEDLTTRLAVDLVHLQGRLDGRATALLMKLARAPGDVAQRVEFARHAAAAVWRRVREDPTDFLHWPTFRPFADQKYPSSIEDLRELLSEPSGPLPANELGLAVLLHQRTMDGGPWTSRPDRFRLFEDALLVPGTLPVQRAALLVANLSQEALARAAFEAEERLSSPEDHSAAAVAGDIALLRLMAGRSAAVEADGHRLDLRAALPTIVARVLESLDRAADSSFAALEGGVLRLCARVVVGLARGQLPLREELWLTFRLCQWLSHQLNQVPPSQRKANLAALGALIPPAESKPRDVMDAAWVGATTFDLRACAIVLAIGMSDAVTRREAGDNDAQRDGPRLDHTALLPALQRLASRAPTASEQLVGNEGIKSVLDPDFPSSTSNAALDLLIYFEPAALLRLEPAVRLRLIRAIPVEPALALESARNGSLVVACLSHANEVSAEELAALEELLKEWDGRTEERALVPVGLAALFAAGREALFERVRASVIEAATEPWAAEVVDLFLRGLRTGTNPPDRWRAEVGAVLHAQHNAGTNFFPTLEVVTRLLEQTDGLEALAFLDDLVQRAPFAADQRISGLAERVRAARSPRP